MITVIELNDAQRAVAEAPIDARLLVFAGAGQGKTEVVAARIGFLVSEEELSASTEILVLSFSRAAVTAVRNRLDLREIAAANVRTFDSFAGQVLLDADEEPKGGYEARIRQATQILATAEEVPAIEYLRHLVMDEVQDLVGDRAELVLALLDRLDRGAGITALGDPLQGVYDFQLEQSKVKTPATAVFDALERKFGAKRIGLGQNYRARGKEPKEISLLGEQLREIADANEALAVLAEFEEDVLLLGEIDEWAELADSDGQNTAILCETNGEVLRVSKYLNDNGIRHAVRRQAQEFGAANWVARALGALAGPVVGRSDVEAALAEALGPEVGDDAWYLLKSAEGNMRNRESLNLAKLRTLIRSGNLPLALTEPDVSDVIISTIHRAKGLEFDRVFLLEPSYARDEDPWTAIRKRYVALSRARDEIFLCGLPKTYSIFKEEHFARGRLLERQRNYKRKSMRTNAVEFRYSDVEVDTPVEACNADAKSVQNNLRDPSLIGSRLEARLDIEQSTADAPSYLLTTEHGRTIGRTSESFNEAFVNAFSLRRGSFPAILHGLSVVSVESVAGDPRMSQRMDVSFSGMWLAPRVIGLAQPDWSNREEIS